jgi:hypothetical protein
MAGLKLFKNKAYSALSSVSRAAVYAFGFVVFFDAGMALAAGGVAAVANPGTANEIAQNIVASSGELPGLVAALCYMIGIGLGAFGILKIKEHVDNPSQAPLKGGVIRLLAGGALFALPMIYNAAYTTINGTNTVWNYTSGALQKLGTGGIFTFGGGGGTNEVNDIAQNLVTATNQFPALLAGICYLIALLLGATAIFKIKDHVENPTQTPIRIGAIRLLIAGALLALPTIYQALYVTFSGGTSTLNIDSNTIISTMSGMLGTISNLIPTGNFNNVLSNILNATQEVPAAIAALSYLLAILFGATGLLKLKDHVENPDQNPLKESVIRLLVSGALFAMPSIYNAMFNAVAGGGIGVMASLASALGATNFFTSTYAGTTCNPFAGMLGSVGGLLGIGGGMTAGESMCGIVTATGMFPAFLAALAYMIGLIFGLWGIMKIKAHVQNPGQTSLWEGLSRLLAGGAFFALPIIVEVARSTIAPGSLGVMGLLTGTTTGYNNAGAATCGGGGGGVGGGPAAAAGGLDVVLTCFMGDMMGPTHIVLNFFAFCAGTVLIMVGISRLIKSAQDGARGPGGIGTLMTFITGGALISYNDMMKAFTSTFFGSGTTQTFATMQYTAGMTGQEVAAAHATISAILQFVIIVGLISFVRGIFIIRGVAEGNQQSSIMSGITHIVAGTLAVNLGPLINAVQATLGLTGVGIGFS